MARTIKQKVVFKNVKTSDLYHLYMNSKKHSQVTSASAKISSKEGADFSVYDEYITGKNFRLIKDKLIVQTSRASTWNDSDMDSTFIILFEQKGKDATLEMIHANVPEGEAESLSKGWYQYYWNLWKRYLTGKPIKRVII